MFVGGISLVQAKCVLKPSEYEEHGLLYPPIKLDYNDRIDEFSNYDSAEFKKNIKEEAAIQKFLDAGSVLRIFIRNLNPPKIEDDSSVSDVFREQLKICLEENIDLINYRRDYRQISPLKWV